MTLMTPLHAADESVNGRLREALQLLSIADLDNLPPLAWLVPGVLPARALTVLYGPPGVGKSFIALGLALCIASSCDWVGGRPVSAGPVVYIAAEGVGGLKRRIDAWSQHNEVDKPEAIRFLPVAVNLLDAEDAERAATTIERLTPPPVLIVVDTMARCLVGGDENSARDVGQFIHNLDQLRAAFDAAALVVHHTGKKGDEERGSSALRGAADAMHSLSQHGGGLKLECTKLKDDEPEPALALLLVKSGESLAIKLGNDPAAIGRNDRQILEHLTATAGEGEAARQRFLDALTPSPLSVRTLDRCLRSLSERGFLAKRKQGNAAFYKITAPGRAVLLPPLPDVRQGNGQTLASHATPVKGGDGVGDGPRSAG